MASFQEIDVFPPFSEQELGNKFFEDIKKYFTYKNKKKLKSRLEEILKKLSSKILLNVTRNNWLWYGMYYTSNHLGEWFPAHVKNNNTENLWPEGVTFVLRDAAYDDVPRYLHVLPHYLKKPAIVQFSGKRPKKQNVDLYVTLEEWNFLNELVSRDDYFLWLRDILEEEQEKHYAKLIKKFDGANQLIERLKNACWWHKQDEEGEKLIKAFSFTFYNTITIEKGKREQGCIYVHMAPIGIPNPDKNPPNPPNLNTASFFVASKKIEEIKELRKIFGVFIRCILQVEASLVDVHDSTPVISEDTIRQCTMVEEQTVKKLDKCRNLFCKLLGDEKYYKDEVKKVWRLKMDALAEEIGERMKGASDENKVTALFFYSEPGTGKETLAKIAHIAKWQKPPANGRNYYTFNMANFDEERLYRILKVCNKEPVTIFFDEFNTLKPEGANIFLRFLEDPYELQIQGKKEVLKPKKVLAIFASNLNLEDLVRKQKFNEAVIVRLAKNNFEIPPLRERKEDIALFVCDRLVKAAEKNQTRAKHIDISAMRLLVETEFPGNYRGLQGFMDELLQERKKRDINDPIISFKEVIECLRKRKLLGHSEG